MSKTCRGAECARASRRGGSCMNEQKVQRVHKVQDEVGGARAGGWDEGGAEGFGGVVVGCAWERKVGMKEVQWDLGRRCGCKMCMGAEGGDEGGAMGPRLGRRCGCRMCMGAEGGDEGGAEVQWGLGRRSGCRMCRGAEVGDEGGARGAVGPR
jgi:hypothetical protein